MLLFLLLRIIIIYFLLKLKKNNTKKYLICGRESILRVREESYEEANYCCGYRDKLGTLEAK